MARLLQRAVCHFGERATTVNEETWSKEFEGRELGLFLVEGAGLFACIFGAIARHGLADDPGGERLGFRHRQAEAGDGARAPTVAP